MAVPSARVQDRSEHPPNPQTVAAADDFPLAEKTIDELQTLMQMGQATARSLTQQYLDRIEAIDTSGPTLRSVIELNPEALALADELDAERARSGPRGPLHGIPILLKDNIDTADRMSTTAGSLALVGPPPERDAFLVERLRRSGAVILGKTNLSEWANIRSSASTSGWSGRGGQTKNPYVLDRNPCGSSSGSGVAVSANLCAVAVGTETDGSIVCPASACGVVGIKPTVGLVSRSGIIPISASKDSAGPMARTVRDAAIVLGVLAGADPTDPATQAPDAKFYDDYTAFLDAEGLRGARLGVARNFFHFNGLLDRCLEGALQALRDAGAILIDCDLSGIDDATDAERTVFEYELKAGLATYFARRGANSPMKSLADLIAFNAREAAREMPYFGQEFFLESEKRGLLSDFAYLEARARCLRLARTEGIDRALDAEKLDAIIAPTLGPATPIDLICGDHWLGGSTSPAAMAGYPSISVPAAWVHGLPVGLSFFGRAWSEPTLLKLSYAFEQRTRLRQPPGFLPSLALA